MPTATFVVLFFMNYETLLESLFPATQQEVYVEDNHYTAEHKIEDLPKKFRGRLHCLSKMCQYTASFTDPLEVGSDRSMMVGDLAIFEDGDVWIRAKENKWKHREDLQEWGRKMIRSAHCSACKHMLNMRMSAIGSTKKGLCIVCDTDYELMEKED